MSPDSPVFHTVESLKLSFNSKVPRTPGLDLKLSMLSCSISFLSQLKKGEPFELQTESRKVKWPARARNSTTVAHKGTMVVPLWATYGLRARAGSNHYFLVRPKKLGMPGPSHPMFFFTYVLSEYKLVYLFTACFKIFF